MAGFLFSIQKKIKNNSASLAKVQSGSSLERILQLVKIVIVWHIQLAQNN